MIKPSWFRWLRKNRCAGKIPTHPGIRKVVVKRFCQPSQAGCVSEYYDLGYAFADLYYVDTGIHAHCIAVCSDA